MHNSAEQRVKPLVILVLSVKWPAETFIWQTLKGLADQEAQIILGVSVEPLSLLPKIQQRGIRFLRLPVWRKGYIKLAVEFTGLFLKALFFPGDFLNILNQTKKKTKVREKIILLYELLPFAGLKPTVIHFQWNSAAIDYLPLFDFFNVPVVISCRGAQINVVPYDSRRAYIRIGLEKTFSKAKAVHCVSDAIQREAMDLGLAPAKTHLIRPAVDADFFIPGKVKRQEDSFCIVSTGNLIWRKGYEYALQAIRCLVDENINVQYFIIGEGSERQRVLYTIHDLKIQNHVRLLGNLEPNRVRSILHASDTFLLSSLSEGISNAALEAMACGLPIVTADCGGMKEAVTDQVEGFVVPVRDPKAMAQSLIFLAKNPQRRTQMGQAGREKILKDFSLKNQIKDFLNLYQSIL